MADKNAGLLGLFADTGNNRFESIFKHSKLKLLFMPWWVIVIGIIILLFMLEYFLKNKKTKQLAKRPLQSILEANEKARQAELLRRQPADEELSQKIKNLFYSATWNETRNLKTFHNILKELLQIRKDILFDGGIVRMKRITDRVIVLCGDDMIDFQGYVSILRDEEESTGVN